MSINPNSSEEDKEWFDWIVDLAHVGQRIDKFVAEALEETVSRTHIQQWMADGYVKLNNKFVKPSEKVALDDEITCIIPDLEPLLQMPEHIPLDVYYEDADVIVINKPRGLVVHPAPGHYTGTLVNALLYHCQDLSGINGVLRPGIVHRIDKDTSGLIVVAKSDHSHAGLAEQFRAHTVVRKYVAIVHGKLAHEHGTIDAPIGRDAKDRKKYAVTDRNSKSAITHFVVLERFSTYTMVELSLETGRTHQIRVHMKFIGHPLVGDPLYGKSKSITMDHPGQVLHAAILGFKHPIHHHMLNFEAPLPPDIEQLLLRIRG